MKLADWKGGKGVNKDLLPSELELGMWSDANNFRFRNGHDEKMGGIAEIMASCPITPYGLFDYQTTTARFVVAVGIAKAYVHNGTSWTQITRNISPVAISGIVDGASTTKRTATTSTAHNLTTGDVITIYGCTGATADDYNAANVSITVLSSTTFEYEGGGAANPAAVAGSPAYYVISSSNQTDFTGAIDDKITGGHLAGVFLLNNPVDGLYYWAGDTTKKLRNFDITTYKADVGKPHGEWFFQLAPTMSGTKYPRRVLWSAGAEPGSLPASFDAASTNDAGTFELDDTNGFLVDCCSLGDILHIYKDDQRYAAQWIGGNDVFRFTPVHDSSGLMARNCIANTTDGRQVFLTKSCDIRMHAGGKSESIAEGRVRQYLQSDIDSTNKARAFLCQSPYTKEIWVFYPRSGSSTCNGALVWNWEANTWAISHRSLNITAANAGLLPTSIATERRMIIATSTPKIGLVDSGTTDFGSTITATRERTGIHLDAEEVFKTLQDSSISGDMTAGNTATVYHGSHKTADGSVTWTSGSTYTQGTTDRICAITNSAKYLAWKMSTTASDWKDRTIRFFGVTDGEF